MTGDAPEARPKGRELLLARCAGCCRWAETHEAIAHEPWCWVVLCLGPGDGGGKEEGR